MGLNYSNWSLKASEVQDYDDQRFNPDSADTELDACTPAVDLETPDRTPSPPDNQEGLPEYERYASKLEWFEMMF